MNLFEATAADVPRIEECARKCCAEHGEERSGGALDWDCYSQCLRSLIENPKHGAMWLYEDGKGRVVAGSCGAITCDPLTGLHRASRVFLYALPEYRGQVSVLRLVRLYERWAKENGCKIITMSWLDTMPEGTERAYKALGYAEQETIYIKVL